jgi:hypothetical protein
MDELKLALVILYVFSYIDSKVAVLLSPAFTNDIPLQLSTEFDSFEI